MRYCLWIMTKHGWYRIKSLDGAPIAELEREMLKYPIAEIKPLDCYGNIPF